MKVSPIRKQEVRFEKIEPQDLEKTWALVESSLAIVRKRSKGTWTVRHVYSAIFHNQAILQLVYMGDLYAGFLVLTPYVDPYNGEPWMVVWACYSRLPGAVDMAFPLLEQFSRDCKFKGIRLQSPRKGWVRRLAPKGFKVRDYLIEKEF